MPSPFAEALASLNQRTPTGADLGSSEWRDVPAALRARAFFSARVQNTRYLQDIKDAVESILHPRTETNDEGAPVTRGLNLASARAELKQVLQRLNYDPGEKAGGLQDLSSDSRLELQLKTNVESAQGFGAFLQGQAAGAIDAFPAQELFRVEDREEPRSWPTRWMQAGGQIFGGRMIALKNDPVWFALSDADRFGDALGNPYPPFAFNSGMWVRDIARDEAIALGLMTDDTVVQPQAAVEQFNTRLEASVKDIAPDLLASLQRSFGSQVLIEGGTARWAS